MKNSVYDLSKIEENLVGDKVFSEEVFEKWRNSYIHPLMLSNVARNARNLGVEIKNVNDWLQFLSDRDVNKILFSENPRDRISGFFHFIPPIEEEKEEDDEI